ncbi:MAG: discoidin domain-containing protein [Pirellulales bacterium]|nr:discoidin domain-containing protein [Pirellulales bacterium]
MRIRRMRLVPFGWLILAIVSLIATAASAENAFQKDFASPPGRSRPWVYWWWLNSNVTREGITRDLEEMKRQGIEGAMIFNAGGGDTPKGPTFLGDEWSKLFAFALDEMSRLGMEASVNLCDGWCAGGSWIPPEAANKMLVWSELQVDGPGDVVRALPNPPALDGFYRDVAVVAIRESAAQPVRPAAIRTNSLYWGHDYEYDWLNEHAADGDPNTLWRSREVPTPDKPVWLEYRYAEPLTASSVYLAGAAEGGPRECELQASDDGREFTTVASFALSPGKTESIAFPPTTARIFRLLIKSAHPPDARLAEMWLLREGDRPALRPGIKWWLFKSGNRSFWHQPREGSAVLNEKYPDDGAFDCRSAEVVDLTSRLGADGTLRWRVPEGRWSILRFGYTLEGQRTRCSSTVIGYEADQLDVVGVETHFKHCAEPMLRAAGDHTGKTLKYLHVDSHELGQDVRGQQPTWSAHFREEFLARRGYDPIRYLPAMARRIVDDRTKTNRFLWDVRMTISDLYVERFFGRLAELAHARGVGIHCETGYGTGPHPHFDGLRAAGQCDVTMGEFWWGTDVMTLSDHYANAIRSVASPAHVYGLPIIQAESFTTWVHFQEYPATLKPVGDRAFCDGLNRVMVHQYTHQPNDDRPGYQYFAGTHLDRHVTWWNYAKPFLDYQSRCQHLLQAGRFHADVCYFYGEGSAKYVPSKQYLKPELPPGYNFDCVNAEVLHKRMRVEDGRLVLPDGIRYRLLVLPTDRVMTPGVLRRIRELVEAGAVVLGERPLRAPGLTDWPDCDRRLVELADAMWGKDPGPAGQRAIGRGLLVWGRTPGELLASIGVPPDFETPDNNKSFEFIHRVIDGTDVYFVSNQSDQLRSIPCTFRSGRRRPELWDPVAGTVRDLPEFTLTDDGRVRASLTFAPYQSYFVVFQKPADHSDAKPGGPTNFDSLDTSATLAGPWTVAFDPRWGGPEEIVFDDLVDWTTRPEEGIKYYSGTAVYRKTFDLPETPDATRENRRLFLDLGTVNHVARVRLNGKDLGILWTAPWRVDVTGVVKAKGNRLEIEVVNTWLNRLVGDAHLPPEKRLAKTNAAYPPNQPLLPSGLLGPVTVQQAK